MKGWGTAIRLLTSLAKPPNLKGGSSSVTTTDGKLDCGTEYTLYSPHRAPSGSLLAVPGVTVLGRDDPRLIHFATAHARFGFATIVPDLPGLKTARIIDGDRTAIQNGVRRLLRTETPSVIAAGFSFGAGLLLTALAEMESGTGVDAALCIGAPYAIEEVWDQLLTIDIHQEMDQAVLDNVIYFHLIIAWRERRASPLSEGDQQALRQGLSDYCQRDDPAWKLTLYRRFADSEAVRRAARQPLSPEQRRSISPQHKLSRLSGRVALIHDKSDKLIPPSHSERILTELNEQRPNGDQRIALTSLLSHVAPRQPFSLKERVQLVDLYRHFLYG